MNNRFLLILITSIAPLIWGSTYLVTTEFLPPDRPFIAALFRVLPAGLLLILWKREIPNFKDGIKIFLLGILNIGFFQAMLFVAAYRLPGGLAAILGSTQTLLILVLAWLIDKEQPPKTAWLATLLGIIGIALLVYSPETEFDAVGIIAALLGATSMAVGIFFSKRCRIHLSLLSFTGWQLLFGGLILMPVVWLLEPLPSSLTPTNIGGYLYLCLFGTVLAYILFFYGISKLPPAVVSSLGLLSPVSAFVLGWLFLNQSMGMKSLFGFLLALLSIFGVQHALSSLKKDSPI